MDPLSSTHDIHWIITGPEYLGWPTKRPRMFCCGINKKRLKFVGRDDYRTDFMEKFYRMAQISGDALFCAPDNQVHQSYSDLARVQGHNVKPEDVPKFKPLDLLPYLLSAGQLQIFQEHLEEKAEKQGLDGSFIADIQQHPGRASSSGPDFPCQLTHGTVVTFRDDGKGPRIATGMEHLGAQGYHLFEASCCDHPLSKMLQPFQKLKEREQKLVSGNAVHLAPLAAWLFYNLANIERVRGD